MFQLAITSDNLSELMEAGSHGICKVDFVNNIIAAELINIVSQWHEGLTDFPEPVIIQGFFRKQGRLMSEIIRYSFPVLLLIIASLYSDYLNPMLGIGTEISLNNIQKISILLGAVFASGMIIGGKVERYIDIKISEFESFPSFLITRGDEKAKNEFEKNNDKLTKQISSKIIWILTSFSITSGLKFLLNYINAM